MDRVSIAEIRFKRTEQDIETLRSTQTALMDRIDSFAEMLEETRDIADHLDLTYEKPPQGAQPD